MTIGGRLGAAANAGGRALAERVAARLDDSWCFAWIPIEATSERALADALFAALVEDRIDLALLPLEALEAPLPAPVHLAVVPRREEGEDRWFEAPTAVAGAVRRVGTDHAWRAARLRGVAPSLDIVLATNDGAALLERVAAGDLDAAVLSSAAGAERRGLKERAFDEGGLPPRPGQGALAALVRRADTRTARALEALGDVATAAAVTAERAAIERLGLAPDAAFGARATLSAGSLRLAAAWLPAPGEPIRRVVLDGALTAASTLGVRVAEALLRAAE